MDHDLAGNQAANELWCLLTAQHPLGPTTVSKLMAAKRPHLIPIDDSYVAAALLPKGLGETWEWWRPWRDLLTGPQAGQLHAAVQAVRSAAAAEGADLDHLSELRVLDIVIWSAEEQRRRS